MKDRTGCALSRADQAEFERMNRENAAAARRSIDQRLADRDAARHRLRADAMADVRDWPTRGRGGRG